MGQVTGSTTFTVNNNGVTQTVPVTFTGNYGTGPNGPFIQSYNLKIPCDVVNNPALLNQIKNGLTDWAANQVLNTRDAAGITGNPNHQFTADPSQVAENLIEDAKKCANVSDLDPDQDITASIYPSRPFVLSSLPSFHDPLVLDLQGTGLQLTSVTNSPVYFDFNNSGTATQTGWITPGEGLLLLNNGSGNLSQELLGAQSGNGFADLQ